MNVSLIDYTGKGSNDPVWYAARLLAIAKGTRLEMSSDAVDRWMSAEVSELQAELAYAARTIPSSWEFIHYTFLVTGVSRAFTHQMVRTRTASYAQQTMRTVDVREADVLCTMPEDHPHRGVYLEAVRRARTAYTTLLEQGVKPEDARGILPTNIKTNIVVGINLRNFCDLVKKRRTYRTQTEYREVVEQMVARVHSAHPWAVMFTEPKALEELAELERHIQGDANLDPGKRMDLLKSVDLVRSEVGG